MSVVLLLRWLSLDYINQQMAKNVGVLLNVIYFTSFFQGDGVFKTCTFSNMMYILYIPQLSNLHKRIILLDSGGKSVLNFFRIALTS